MNVEVVQRRLPELTQHHGCIANARDCRGVQPSAEAV